MSPSLESHQHKEALSSPTWETVDVRKDQEKFLQELADFWDRQSATDRVNRFLTPNLSTSEIIRRYRFIFPFTQYALALHHEGELIGLFLATEDSAKPGWFETSTEIDHAWRHRGYAIKAHELLYRYILAHDYLGIIGLVRQENAASLALLARFTSDKPHFIKQGHGTVTYFIGKGAENVYSLDLLD